MALSKSRIIRIGVSGTVLIAAAVILSPYLFNEIRSNGIINARLVTLNAPISGLITRTKTEIGDHIKAEEILSHITDSSESEGLAVHLDIDLKGIIFRIEGLSKRISKVEEMKTELEIRVEQYAKEMVENIKLRKDEAIAQEKFWEAVSQERLNALTRQQNLLKSGIASPARVEEATSLSLQAREEINRVRANVKRLTQELKAASEGVFVNEGQSDVPYSRQRLDEVRLTLYDLKLQLSEAKDRKNAIGVGLSDENERASKRKIAVIHSPIEGIIWQRSAENDTFVIKNKEITKILDCSVLYVEVSIKESFSDRISVGQEVKVRLQGGKQFFSAKIKEIRGKRTAETVFEYAAQSPPLKKDELLMVAVLSNYKPYDIKSNFCNVGRRVEVVIDGGLFILGQN